MNEQKMRTQPLIPLILSMTIPMMLSMLVNSLYNIVDSYFVARISEDAMTALSLVFPVQNLVNAMAIGFGVGVNAAAAFYLGARKKEKANQAASQGMLLSFIHGIILMVACSTLIPFFLHLFTTDTQLISLGVRYARIVFLFSSIVNMGITAEKIYQSAGKMNVTVVGLAMGCIVNMILDPVLIFGLGVVPAMGIEGAALATGIGQVATLAYYIAIYFKKPHTLQIQKKYFNLDTQMFNRLYSVGIPAALNMALPSLLISALNAILSVFSPAYILVLGIYYKLQTFLYLPASGMIQGMRPLLSFHQGAREYTRMKKIFRIVMAMVAILMAVGTVLFMTFPEMLMELFTSNLQTIQIGKQALQIISLGFIISAVSVTVSGALEALSMGKESLLISLCRYVIIIIPVAWIFSKLFGVVGVWHAFWMAEGMTACISMILYRKHISFTENVEIEAA